MLHEYPPLSQPSVYLVDFSILIHNKNENIFKKIIAQMHVFTY